MRYHTNCRLDIFDQQNNQGDICSPAKRLDLFCIRQGRIRRDCMQWDLEQYFSDHMYYLQDYKSDQMDSCHRDRKEDNIYLLTDCTPGHRDIYRPDRILVGQYKYLNPVHKLCLQDTIHLCHNK